MPTIILSSLMMLFIICYVIPEIVGLMNNSIEEKNLNEFDFIILILGFFMILLTLMVTFLDIILILN